MLASKRLAILVVLVMLAIPLLGMTIPNAAVFGVHPAGLLMAAAYVQGLRMVSSTHAKPMWLPRRTGETLTADAAANGGQSSGQAGLWLNFGVAACMTATAGWLLALPISSFLTRFLLAGVSRTITTLFVRVNVTEVALSPEEIAFSLGVTLAVAVLAAVQPAWEAMRTSPQGSLHRSALESKAHQATRWLLLIFALLAAAVCGVVIPLVLKRFGIDPGFDPVSVAPRLDICNLVWPASLGSWMTVSGPTQPNPSPISTWTAGR